MSPYLGILGFRNVRGRHKPATCHKIHPYSLSEARQISKHPNLISCCMNLTIFQSMVHFQIYGYDFVSHSLTAISILNLVRTWRIVNFIRFSFFSLTTAFTRLIRCPSPRATCRRETWSCSSWWSRGGSRRTSGPLSAPERPWPPRRRRLRCCHLF